MTTKDPYNILGVARGASADDIKRAYRKLAKQHHPDRNPGDESAERKFKEIQAAYEVVGDPERRTQYDRFGAGGPPPQYQQWGGAQGRSPFGQDVQFNFNGMGDLSDIFEQFFNRGGGGARSRTARRGGASHRQPPTPPPQPTTPIEHELTISFSEAVRGATRRIDLRRSDGQLVRLDVKIPAGIDDGQSIRVTSRGQPQLEGVGDVLIRCRVAPHPHFRREGLDLVLDLPISVPEAILGARVDIPTLDGEMRLTVPAGATSGMRLRLRGKGIRNARGDAGDLYASLRVMTPREVSDELRAAVTEHAAAFGGSPRDGLAWTI
ncbi:MAG: DnaJ C-terminal domain-containing protein [Phycisphaerae bacterium]